MLLRHLSDAARDDGLAMTDAEVVAAALSDADA